MVAHDWISSDQQSPGMKRPLEFASGAFQNTTLDEHLADLYLGARLNPGTSGKQGISPGWCRASVPVAQPGLTNWDWSPIISHGCCTNRD
jgi:hypothetical protein